MASSSEPQLQGHHSNDSDSGVGVGVGLNVSGVGVSVGVSVERQRSSSNAEKKKKEVSETGSMGTEIEKAKVSPNTSGCWGRCLFCHCDKRSRNKVPRVTAVFWFVKIVATTLGEVRSDTLDGFLPPGMGIVLAGGIFCIVVPMNVVVDHYVPSLYWFTIALISVVGTQLTDMIDYPEVEVPIGVVLLLAVFYFWDASQGTLDIKTIFIRRREAWYWLCVCVTFATGTAIGDMMADQAGLGDWQSCLFFVGLFCLVVVSWYIFHLNSIAAFWVAYVLTRPMGTNFGDYLEGFLGPGYVALIFFLILLVSVLALTWTKYDTYDDDVTRQPLNGVALGTAGQQQQIGDSTQSHNAAVAAVAVR